MSNVSALKRQRERARQDHQRDKDLKKKQRRADRNNKPPAAAGEDPDIAGIVPGPQPPSEET
jgi:hypothetical protein